MGIVLTNMTIKCGGGCLLKGTIVSLGNGTRKPIEDITYEDNLLVWDFDKGCISNAKPAWIQKKMTNDYFFICKFANGKELRVTGTSKTGYGHRGFNVTRSSFTYFPASVGDEFLMEDGTISELVSCEKRFESCEYYNIITERHFNIYANEVLTSCSLNNFRKIENFKFVGQKHTVLTFNAFKQMLDVGDNEVKIKEYFDKLRISEMSMSDVVKNAEYVAKLISLEKRK